jgi:hypothetical protein
MVDPIMRNVTTSEKDMIRATNSWLSPLQSQRRHQLRLMSYSSIGYSEHEMLSTSD